MHACSELCLHAIMADLILPHTCSKKPPMPPLDLTLAINYIPAVVCLAKAVLISFCLCILNPGTHLGGFIIFAMLLNIDRAVYCARIFDENAVQLCILAAWVINYLRVASEASRFINPVVSGVWAAFGVVLTLEPKAVQELFVLYGHGSGGTVHKIMPAVITSVFVAAVSYTPLPVEQGAIKSARAIGFACLCVAWVYVVSVWKAKPRHNKSSCVFETHALIARFCLVLYVDWMLAAVFGAWCVACLAYHYVQIHVVKDDSKHGAHYESIYADVRNNSLTVPLVNNNNNTSSPITMDLQIPVSSQIEMAPIEEEDDEALEAYFRSACQSRRENA